MKSNLEMHGPRSKSHTLCCTCQKGSTPVPTEPNVHELHSIFSLFIRALQISVAWKLEAEDAVDESTKYQNAMQGMNVFRSWREAQPLQATVFGDAQQMPLQLLEGRALKTGLWTGNG